MLVFQTPSGRYHGCREESFIASPATFTRFPIIPEADYQNPIVGVGSCVVAHGLATDGTTMRRSLEGSGATVEGWDKKASSRPTPLMIATMFLSMVVIRAGEQLFLASRMSQTQREYLNILGFSPRTFSDQHVQCGADPSQESKSWATAG